ncbi:MAG: zinc ribbon domain-containing protein [Gammaproteobacteria bacterium]|nr:zinc ribbon domain-containing protein [Gammaproteobacteria bacterium]
MPSYDYRCEKNGQVVEVMHKMSEKLSTWGELCEKANMELGDTPAETPVVRLITGGNVVSSAALSNPEAPACSSGGCGGGMCGLN